MFVFRPDPVERRDSEREENEMKSNFIVPAEVHSESVPKEAKELDNFLLGKQNRKEHHLER